MEECHPAVLHSCLPGAPEQGMARGKPRRQTQRRIVDKRAEENEGRTANGGESNHNAISCTAAARCVALGAPSCSATPPNDDNPPRPSPTIQTTLEPHFPALSPRSPSSQDPIAQQRREDDSPLWEYVGPGLVDGWEEGPDEGEDSKLDPEDGGVEDEGGDEGRGRRARRPGEV